MTIRFSDYLIVPRDVVAWVRALGRRDLTGLAIMLVAGGLVGLWLGDAGAGLFAAGLAGAVWWRVDSRWAFGAALAFLVLIPLMQFAYDRNWLFAGAGIASGLAVAVWYLLAIGVVRQLVELRAGEPAVAPAAARVSAAPAGRPRAAPAAGPPAPRAPAPVPSWRRRLAAIEREARTAAPDRTAMDGIKRKRP